MINKDKRNLTISIIAIILAVISIIKAVLH